MRAHYHPEADYDVVIVGGGPAGLSAAWMAAVSEAKVLLLSPSGLSRKRRGGALILPGEHKDWASALGVGPKDLVQVSRALPVVTKWIYDLSRKVSGVEWREKSGTDGLSWIFGDGLASSLMAYMEHELVTRPNLTLMRGGFLIEVNTAEDRVVGVSAVGESQKRIRIRAPQVVLCTGGVAGLFSHENYAECGTALWAGGFTGAKRTEKASLVTCPRNLSSSPGWEPVAEESALREDRLEFYKESPLYLEAGASPFTGEEGGGMSARYPVSVRGILDLDATGETTIEGLRVAGLAQGWGPLEACLPGVPLLNALITGVVSGQSAATSPPDPALPLSSDLTGKETGTCTDTDLPSGFATEKRRRLASIMRRTFFKVPSALDRDAARVEVLKLRGEARDFKRFRESIELWRLYHACEAALILLQS
ncbi:MAG: FAD-dependent oxidoreductase [bacterium JZ-2024 1]